MIEIKNLCGGYGKNQILNDISLTFREGQITTLTGVNGCGKSTFLKAVTGILPVTSGEISINGKKSSDFSNSDIAKEIAYLPQSRNLPDMTVFNMVLHGRFPHLSYPRKYSKNDIEIAMQAIKEMEIDDLKDRKLTELSGGMRQKAYIAMALAQGSPTILMDEPTSFLDIGFTFKLMGILEELKGKGKNIVLVLHDLLLALKTSDYIAVMDNGRIVAYGTPDEIYSGNFIKEVFGVAVERTETGNGKEYYYRGSDLK